MEPYPKSRFIFSLSLVFTLITLYVPICSARQDVWQRYWWLDEMRVVAQSLSKAKLAGKDFHIDEHICRTRILAENRSQSFFLATCYI